MTTPTLLQGLVCKIAYHLHTGLLAFDAWSPVSSPYFIVWGFMVYSMDTMGRKWFSIASVSKGNIFKHKPIPGKKLKLNWDYIDTLHPITKLNFYRIIAIFHGRLQYAGYSKLTKYPVFSSSNNNFNYYRHHLFKTVNRGKLIASRKQRLRAPLKYAKV